MSVRVYGLEKCSTCQKARNWLTRRRVEHKFIDYREQRTDPATLKAWAKAGEIAFDAKEGLISAE